MEKHYRRTQKIYKELQFKLTEQELIETAKLAATLEKEVCVEALELAVYVKEVKTQIKNKATRVKDKLRLIDDGFELRVVQCDQITDYSDAVVQYWVEGKLIEERAMTKEELELTMPLPLREKQEPREAL